MTVAELQELLSKYDGDRTVLLGGNAWYEIDGVRSIEPEGVVVLVVGSFVPVEARFGTSGE